MLNIYFAIIAAIWCAVGFLIFWRRSDDWLALLAAFFLVIFGLNASGNSTFALPLAYPVFALPFGLVSFLELTSLFASFPLIPRLCHLFRGNESHALLHIKCARLL
jgi:hypothetical protein